jgi:predicted short-subunit dehydrogenase-like oxidoreductase (DUF2520 family)
VERIAFVGPGRVGLALGHALAESGEVGHLLYYGRRPTSPEHPLFHSGAADFSYGIEAPPQGTTALFLTVPDSALPEVVYALASAGDAPVGCALFHTSGALGIDVLSPLHDRGYSVGSMHPLRSVADTLAGHAYFEGSYFALSGEPDALRAGERILHLLGARGLTIPTNRRPHYHAGAVIASNHLVFLLHDAMALLREAGVEDEEALAALVSLARGTLDNIEHLGVEGALTGPLLRGDVETIELHLRILTPEMASAYVALARRGLEWVRGGLSTERADRLDELFKRYA